MKLSNQLSTAAIVIATSVLTSLVTVKFMVEKKLLANSEVVTSVATSAGENSNLRVKSMVNPACVVEVKKLCQNLSHFNESDACLHDHLNEIKNMSCKNSLVASIDSLEICADDIQKFCQRAKYGGGRMIACLRPVFDKLSADCQTRVGRR